MSTHILFVVVPYIWDDKLPIFWEQKGVKKEDLLFLDYPPCDPKTKKVSRFFSETWIENNIAKGSIEGTLQAVTELAAKKGCDVKFESFDIHALSTEANQVLCFLNDLDRTPSSAHTNYDDFQLH
jgi:hypothetical protein